MWLGVVGSVKTKEKTQPYLKTRFHKTRFHQQIPGVKLMVRNKSVKKRMQNAFLVNVFVNGNIHAIQVAFHKNKNLQTCSTWTLFPSTQKNTSSGNRGKYIVYHPPPTKIYGKYKHNDIMYIQN